MKKTLCIFAIALLAISFNSCSKDDNGDEWIVDDTPIQFEDPNFLEALLQKEDVDGDPINVDTNHDGQISRKEAAQVKSLVLFDCPVRNMEEIKYFTALEYLNCGGTYITSLDVSNNKALKELFCPYTNNLTSLNVKNCAALVKLRCDNSGMGKLASLDVSDCIALELLECYGQPLTSLDLSKNTALTELACGDALISLNVRNCPFLQDLECYSDQLISLDLSQNKRLDDLRLLSKSLQTLYLYKYHNLTNEKIDDIKLYCPNAIIYYEE